MDVQLFTILFTSIKTSLASLNKHGDCLWPLYQMLLPPIESVKWHTLPMLNYYDYDIVRRSIPQSIQWNMVWSTAC